MTDYASDPNSTITEMTAEEMIAGLKCGQLDLGRINYVMKKAFEAAAATSVLAELLSSPAGAAEVGTVSGYTIQERLDRVIYVEDKGGGVAKSRAQNTAALNAAIAALPAGGGQIAFASQDGIYELDPVVIARSDVTLGQGFQRPTLRFPTLGAGVGLKITGHRCVLNNVAVYGPGNAGAFLDLQCAVQVEGASSAARVSGFRARNCEFGYAGRSGLRCKFVDRIEVIDCDALETAYIGTEFMSCNYITQRGGTINVLNAVGTAGNAYGTAYSHDSTDYNLDPNAGLPQAGNPFCNTVLVQGLTVIGPKIWQAIDTHGAYNITITACKTFGAGRGISLTTGSGAAGEYAGWQNICMGNTIDTRLPDGSLPAGMVIADGITLRGPTIGTAQWSIICSLNIIRGYGVPNSVSSGGINASAGNRNFTITGNIIDDWAGTAIVWGGNGSAGGIITSNIFGNCRSVGADFAGSGACIALNNALGGRLTIGNNVHNPQAGKEARWGIGGSGYNPSGPAIIIGVNDFAAATAGLTTTSSHQLMGPGFAGEILVLNASGTFTVDVSAIKLAPGLALTVRFSGHAAAITVTNFTGAPKNSSLDLVNDSANNVNITRASGAFNLSQNIVLTQYDTVTIKRGTLYWHTMAAPSNNG